VSSEDVAHLYVEAGPDKGRQISVPRDGARIGRTDQNDIVLKDPSLSRFHCRVYFSPEGDLWVADLGSTNETLVNHKPIQETALRNGDRIEIGESTILIINDTLGERMMAAAATPAADETSPGMAGAIPANPDLPKDSADKQIDLGFAQKIAAVGPRKSLLKGPLFMVLMLVTVGAIAMLVNQLLKDEESANPPAEQKANLELSYEKVEADNSNIFRYALTLDNETISVQIDNLETDRHIQKEASLTEQEVISLSRSLKNSEFFVLEERYQGIASDIWVTWKMNVVLNKRAHQVRVHNRMEPPGFKKIREMIEEFAQNKLALAALALPPEKLKEKADEAFLQAQKMFNEREVRYGNLFEALKHFELTVWYLETIDPKPQIYNRGIQGVEECKLLLQQRYDSEWFQAERAIKLRKWETAASHLRILCELIPDRSDERYEKSHKKLIDVERRIKR